MCFGLWRGPFLNDLNVLKDGFNKQVSGTIIDVTRPHCAVVAPTSPFSFHSHIRVGLLSPIIKNYTMRVLTEQSHANMAVRRERPPWRRLQNATLFMHVAAREILLVNKS
jgi:hypothetical protein